MTEPTGRIVYILAEYCASELYTGWWLYERERNDGKHNGNPYDWWGWLRDTSHWSRQQNVHDLCIEMEYDPPPVKRYADKFAEWFAATFPNGLRVKSNLDDDGDHDEYKLVEVMKTRPRQRRGTIRTIRGAAMADKRAKA